MTGLLHIQTTKEFGESTVSKILDLVENASSRKSKSEDFISRFAKIYTPAVCYAALALAVLPSLVRPQAQNNLVMAIIRCPECNNEVSTSAEVCPHCGVRISGNIKMCPDCGAVDR